MITSIVWLILLKFNYVNPENITHWEIYIPIQIIEIILYIIALPKFCNFLGILKKEKEN